MGRIENVTALAKKALDKDWLLKQKELKEIALKERRTFERHERIDLREMKGNPDDPGVIVVRFLTNPRTIKTEKMQRPMDVLDIEVMEEDGKALVDEANKNIVAGAYSCWLNTKVLVDQVHDFAKQVGGNLENQTAIIAYYGRQKVEGRPQPAYIFRVIPYDVE